MRVLFHSLLVGLLFVASLSAQGDPVRAVAFQENGQFNEARIEWERVLASKGRHYEALMGLGKALFCLQENGRSGALFGEAEALSPALAAPTLYRGLIQERKAARKQDLGDKSWSDELSAAVHLFMEAGNKTGSSFDCFYWAAEGYRNLGKPTDALRAIQKCRDLRPEDSGALQFQLELQMSEGDLAAVIKATMNLEAFENQREISLIRLQALALRRDFKEASALFEKLIQPTVLGDSPAAWAALFVNWREGSEKENLQEVLLRPAVKSLNSSLWSFYSGDYESMMGNWSAAAAEFQEYVKRVPADCVGRVRLIHSCLAGARNDWASAEVLRALDTCGPDPRILIAGQRVAKAWVDAREFNKALSLQNRLLATDPENLDLLQGQGALLKELGRLDECEVLLRDVLSRGLESLQRARFLNELALCIKGAGRLDEAMSLFEASAAESSFSLDARENLASAHLDRREWQMAEQRLNEVLLMEPGRPRALYYRRLLQDRIR